MNINCDKETKKIVEFLQSIFQQTGKKNVVVGWSGGIDSTVSLFLLSKVLKPENIFVYHLPYTTSHIQELEKIAGKLKLENIKEINIKDIVNVINNKLSEKSLDSAARLHPKMLANCSAFLGSLPALPAGRRLAPPKLFYKKEINKISLGNIMARVRMIILFDQAKKLEALVCGTENKSERLLGYFTRFGDAASDIEPITHLYKTQIYQLAESLGVPKTIIEQAPSAGLWEAQTDECEFGFTYAEADQVLHLYFDEKIPLTEIENKKNPHARRIIDFHKRNWFKQEVPYKI